MEGNELRVRKRRESSCDSLDFTGDSNRGSSTTVRINDSDKVNESLESNITIVTTTHPPVLHADVDNNDNVIGNHSSRYAANQVVIVSNETNKTLVSEISNKWDH